MLPLLQKNNRRYNLDLTSALLLSRGEVVNVLAESGLGQYAQFYPLVFLPFLFLLSSRIVSLLSFSMMKRPACSLFRAPAKKSSAASCFR